MSRSKGARRGKTAGTQVGEPREKTCTDKTVRVQRRQVLHDARLCPAATRTKEPRSLPLAPPSSPSSPAAAPSPLSPSPPSPLPPSPPSPAAPSAPPAHGKPGTRACADPSPQQLHLPGPPGGREGAPLEHGQAACSDPSCGNGSLSAAGRVPGGGRLVSPWRVVLLALHPLPSAPPPQAVGAVKVYLELQPKVLVDQGWRSNKKCLSKAPKHLFNFHKRATA